MTSKTQSSQAVPVITIDGPSGTGKGTIAQLLARELHWHLLDSGALYRLLALAATQQDIDFNDINSLTKLAEALPVSFQSSDDNELAIYLSGTEVSALIRTEDMGNKASQVAAVPSVREALKARQLAFREYPGLVADGRDMGTVIFPDAPLKIYLTASPETRAERRLKQLKQKGLSVNIADLSRDIAERDARDASRTVAPLKPAPDAHVIDTSEFSIEEVMERIRQHLAQHSFKPDA